MAPVSLLIRPYGRQPRRRLQPLFALGGGAVHGSRLATGGLGPRQADGVGTLGKGKPGGSKGRRREDGRREDGRREDGQRGEGRGR